MKNSNYKKTDEHKQKIGEANRIKMLEKWKDPEYRKRMSEVHKGYKYPKDRISATKGKPAWNKGLKGYMSGEKHWNWQGGKVEALKVLRNSLDYKQWRKTVFERDDYTCQCCGKRDGSELQADHVKPFAFFPELRFAVENGRTLCVECHRATPTYSRRALTHAR